MTDKIFFRVDPHNVSNDRFTLSADESHHAEHVLRLKTGHKIWLIDGNGMSYTGEITSLNGSIKGKIYETFTSEGENSWYSHLAVAVLKKSRLELLIEKATELGVNKISIIHMERCGKKMAQVLRLRKIVINSAKQCGRSVFPKIEEFSGLQDFLDINSEKIIAAHWKGTQSISNFLSKENETPSCVVIGPEGDFSDGELDLLNQKIIPTVTLGSRRLRSETAGMYVLSAINEYHLNNSDNR